MRQDHPYSLGRATTLTGSSGNDLFVFSQPIGDDAIYGFNAGDDQIDLIGYAGFTGFDEVKSHLTTDTTGNAVISLADGQSITLYGVAADSLGANNFVFNQTPVTNNAGTMTSATAQCCRSVGSSIIQVQLRSTRPETRTELELIQTRHHASGRRSGHTVR